MKKQIALALSMILAMSFTNIKAETPKGGNLVMKPQVTNEVKSYIIKKADKDEKPSKTETKKEKTKDEKNIKKSEKKDETQDKNKVENKDENKDKKETKKEEKADLKESIKEKEIELEMLLAQQMPKFINGEMPIKSFMNTIELPKNVKFKSVDTLKTPEMEDFPKELVNMLGTIYVQKGDITAKAEVLNIEFPKILFIPEAEGLFLENGIDVRLVKPILGFNTKFVNAEEIINTFFKKMIEKIRTDTFPMPYDFMNIDTEKVMQFQRNEKNQNLYSAGIKGRLLIDGYVLPITAKLHFIKNKDVYRVMFIMYEDAEKNIIEKAEEKILNIATK